MTEKEAIKELHMIRPKGGIIPQRRAEAIDKATSALEEIQQYRALGTVEQLEWCKDASHWKDLYMEKLERYQALEQRAKNLFGENYDLFSCIEELREAREKQVPKKPEYKILKSLPSCPNCGEVNLVQENEYGNVRWYNKFCPDCGQAIDWSGEAVEE